MKSSLRRESRNRSWATNDLSRAASKRCSCGQMVQNLSRLKPLRIPSLRPRMRSQIRIFGATPNLPISTPWITTAKQLGCVTSTCPSKSEDRGEDIVSACRTTLLSQCVRVQKYACRNTLLSQCVRVRACRNPRHGREETGCRLFVQTNVSPIYKNRPMHTKNKIRNQIIRALFPNLILTNT